MILARRLASMLLTLAVLSVLLFRVLTAMPGNPVEMLITSNPGVRPEDVARLKRLRGLDQPWYVQYVRWVWGHHEPRMPPLYQGPRTQGAKVGEAWSLDVGPFLKDPDSSAKPSLKLLTPELSLDGSRVAGVFGSPGIHTVVLVAQDADGLAIPVQIDVEVKAAQQELALRPRFLPGGTKVVDDTGGITVDVAALLVAAPEGTLLALLAGPGTLHQGTYTHVWKEPGQDVVTVQATMPDGTTTLGAFAVDHGPIPDPLRFHPGFIRGELGFSNTYKLPVGDILAGRVLNTLQLMVPAFLLSLLLAIPLGVFTARRQYSWWDHILSGAAFAGTSVPVFWMGILAIILFSVVLRWLPPGGMSTPGLDDVGDRVDHAILPVLVLTLAYTGRWLRYVRTAMLEVLGQDYVRTAKALGLPESQVIWKHALRNALIPVVTVLALSIPSLFSGAVLTETVFSWPGVGRLIFESVMNSDHYVAMVAFLVSASLVMLANLAADGLYVLVDPRLRRP